MIELKIFVSSPGDVGREREITRRVISRLQGEFSSDVKLDPYFWEHEPMLANAGDYQENIPAPGDFDIFLCLLWSRLGSRLGARHRTRGGETFPSGTVYEFENAFRAARRSVTPECPRGRPDMLVFVKKAPLVIEPEPKEARDERYRQFDALQDFIRLAFRDRADGTFAIASNSFTELALFEELLEKGLRKSILDRIPFREVDATLLPATYTDGPPFLGLRHFEKEHAPVFFGRTGAIDAILTQLRQRALAGCAFCLIFGGSGVGKSSLARAGVLPLILRPGVIEGVGLWRYAVFQPRDGAGERPDLFLALARTLLGTNAFPELVSAQTTPEWLAQEFRENPRGIRILLQSALDRVVEATQRELALERPPLARFALLIDQMEELFTLEWIGAPARDAFIQVLAALARSGLVYIIGTLRSDFFSRCEELPELMVLKAGDGAFHLQPPTRAEIAQMIRRSALAGGLRFERDAETQETLDESLLHDAVKQPDALPLLGFALEELYLRRDCARQVLRFADYTAMGGLTGSLGRHAENAYKAWEKTLVAPAEGAATFDTVLRRLVDEASLRDARTSFARVPADKASCETTAAARTFVAAFIEARLLITDIPASGRPFLTLAHEALLGAWSRLANWLERNRTFFRWRARAEVDRARWEAGQRHPSLLIPRGLALEQARQLRAEHGAVLEPALAEYISLSLDAEAAATAAERAAEEEKRATLEAKLTAERLARGAEQRRLFIQKIAGIILFILLVFAIGAGLLARRNAARAVAARADADELNTYLLGDLREQLEEAGRLDLLDSAAQRAEAYLASLDTQPADDSRRTQQLLLAHNLSRLRLSQGRLTEASDTLRAAHAAPVSLGSADSALTIARARVLNALCDLLARTGENAEGQRAGRDALAFLEPLRGVEATELRADVFINLADLQRQSHEYSAAISSITQSLQLIEPLAATAAARTARRIYLRALVRAGDLAAARGDIPAAQEILERRLAVAQEYSAGEPLAPLWKVEHALSHDRLAQFWLSRTQLDKAADDADSALLLWKELLAHDPENLEWLRLQATTQTKRGQIFLAAGQPAEARSAFQMTIAVDEKLTSAAPRNLGWLAGLATAHSLLSDALADLNAAQDSLREATTALEIRRALHADPAGRIDADNTRNLSLSLMKTAAALMNEADYPKAEKLAAEAVALARELTGRSGALPDHRTLLAGALETYGETLVGQERQFDGARLYIEARGLRLALAGEFPGDPESRFDLAKCRLQLGGLYQDGTHAQPAAPDISAARTEYTAALELLQKLAQDFPQNARYNEVLDKAKAALMKIGPSPDQ
jgi:tetratricopeptide (TPR) repeat protein